MANISCLIIADNSDRFRKVSYYQCWLHEFQTHPELAATVLDLDALSHGSNIYKTLFSLLASSYDLLIIHQSAMWHIETKLWRLLAPLIARKHCLKVIFFVNEYRFLWKQLASANQIKATHIASQFPQDVAEHLYKKSLFKGHILSMPNAVDNRLFNPQKTWKERTIDIGFRGDPYPIYLGHNDRERITSYFQKEAPLVGLKTDIVVSRDCRLNEIEWNAFLNSCRAIIGHEAGGSLIDTQDITRNFFDYLHQQVPADAFKTFVERFEESGISKHCISGHIAAPRHLEALATKTVQILFPGRYNDLIQPNQHYISLEKDFSNSDEVFEKLRDDDYCAKLTERAHAHVMKNHLYRHRVDHLIRVLGGKA